MSDCLTELLTFVNSKRPKVNPSNTINVEVTLNSVTTIQTMSLTRSLIP